MFGSQCDGEDLHVAVAEVVMFPILAVVVLSMYHVLMFSITIAVSIGQPVSLGNNYCYRIPLIKSLLLMHSLSCSHVLFNTSASTSLKTSLNIHKKIDETV